MKYTVEIIKVQEITVNFSVKHSILFLSFIAEIPLSLH